MTAARTLTIRDGSIRLGQALKLADLAESGTEAKDLVAAGEVAVNGTVDTRRGRQLVPGDVISFAGVDVIIGGEPPDATSEP